MDPYRRRFAVLSGSFSLADTLMPQPFMRLARILQPCNPAERLWKDCGIIIYAFSPIDLERRVRRAKGPRVQGSWLKGSALPLAASGQFDRYKNFLVSVKNSKSQITNNKQITMTKIPNNKPVWVIGYSNLGFH
ncbi:MAG: hypothetical protein ABF292_12485 [Desulfobacterales bacterium]